MHNRLGPDPCVTQWLVVQHYPKTKKYISLFPPDASASAATGSSDTDKQREEQRQRVSTAMKKGEMDAEPEERMDKSSVHEDGVDGEEEEEMDTSSHRKRKHAVGRGKSKAVPRDAFFEASDDEDDRDG